MRNLKLISHRETNVFPDSPSSSGVGDEEGARSFISLDFDAGLTFVARGRVVVAVGEDDGGGGCEDGFGSRVRWRVELMLKDGDAIVGIHWSLENEALIVATAAGDLLLLKPPLPSDDSSVNILVDDFEEVGCIASGCRCLAASPDEELLLLVTGDSTFVLMTAADFDPITEEKFTDEARQESEAFVNVGWGKKETQFHGSEGKAAALASKIPRSAADGASQCDDGETRVIWRADGQHFAVSFLRGGKKNPAGGDAPGADVGRVIRVFARDGTLFSTSEDVPGLEQSMHWRPSGNLLASSVRRPNKHEIAFFEPNGLRHGDFSLPFKTDQVKVQSLCWNPNSDILAVVLEEVVPSCSSTSTAATFLQLWTSGNCHWYLKQTLLLHRFSAEDRFLSTTALLWDGLAPNRLHVIGGNGRYAALEWTWSVERSNSLSPADLAQVSVIDGDVVKVTPFRLLNVPPPMAAYELKVPFFVNAISCCPWWAIGEAGEGGGDDDDDGGRRGMNDPLPVNGLAVLGTHVGNENAGQCELVFFGPAPPLPSSGSRGGGGGGKGGGERKGFKTRATPLELKRKVRIEMPSGAFPSQFAWVASNVFLFVTGGKHVWLLELPEMSRDCLDVEQTESLKPLALSGTASTSATSERIRSIQPRDSSSVIVQYEDAVFRIFDFRSSKLEDVSPDDEFSRQQSAEEFLLLNSSSSSPSIVSLSSRGSLIVDGDLPLSDCATSMALHRDFLLYTTTRHELVALRLRDSEGAFNFTRLRQIVADRGAGDSTERRFVHAGVALTRAVERGTRLVVCCATETGVVLQMPRGNIETIHPRALLLSSVERSLSRRRFYDAIEAMRRHRLNMNLMHDFDPRMFMENIDEFVSQVKDAQLINLFLTDLEERDVCSTMYADFFRVRGGSGLDGSTPQRRSKVSSSASKVNSICDAVVTSLKKSTNSKFLTSILTALAKKSPPAIAEALTELRTAQTVDEKEADAALKYLVSLVDVDRLFDEALGTYDLRTVVMVAEKSKKDPKEYLPFLNSLNAMEENMRKYSIDVHLKRWENALKHIHACGGEFFDSHLLPLVEDHVLYSEALKLYERRSSSYKVISSKFGAFLIKKRRYREAGVILSRVGDYETAMRAFQLALDWRQMICMAAYLKLTPAEIASLSRDMAESLKAVDRTSEAASLLEQYADDVEEAITILIDGHQWDEALRLMHKHGRIDFIESDFKDAIVHAGTELSSALDALQKDFLRHSERLVIVRKEKWEAAKRKEIEEDGSLCGDGGGRGRRDDDLYSDASSVSGVSDATSKSTRSNSSSSFTKITERNVNKAIKKKEKKMRSLKEGGPYEHLALVEALHTILVNVEKLKPEIYRLLKVQAQFFYDDEALRLSESLTQLQAIIDEEVKRIWPATDVAHPADEDSPHATSNLSRAFDRLRLGPNATANSVAKSYTASPSISQHPDRVDFHLLAPHLQHPPSATMVDGGSKEEEFRMDILDDASGSIVHRSKKSDA